jgi:CBS domain-containing protein
MNIKISDLMVQTPITTRPHKSVGHARDIMHRNSVQSLPVTNGENEVEGIVTLVDVSNGHSDGTPVSCVMSRNVLSVPQYADASIAARMMRNHGIHHLVVTHEKRIVGILSSYDLLRLVEDHRFIAKQPPTSGRNGNNRN